MQEQCYALLIDADNVSAKYIKPILTELSKYGIITYKRIYGDWTSTQHSSWKDELLTNSITPIQQFSYTQGKNSTDSAMIIDAMDILYTNDVDGFCIVSSDSDFTRLVSRLRESGKMVIGMGENKTPEPFRKACDKFTILENLMSEQNPGTTKNETSHDKRSKEKIEDAIIKMIIENQDINKPTGLGEVGSRLVSLYPDFDVQIPRRIYKDTDGKAWQHCVCYFKRRSGSEGKYRQLCCADRKKSRKSRSRTQYTW